ncbi:uncharacterized protein BX664DRAFT_328079 [Halteromyces radiatus]|uniref:uncharacterized protein n=1 Tax=Halteromyces radiatus TaxID=101107 RepID=UPI00221E9BDA|nr:uncharacterized protein BX664DRAFT_328079 [Halteromyces radiatus]KAI8092763.1 hypothetical protein BX664DRAFT_328079 [Halteromyces radiatus]
MMTSNESSPFLKPNDMDQFDQMMAGIMESSISMMFRQLIEPIDSGKHDIFTKSSSSSSSTPPPLQLHDFGGSDFKRLAEKSRRNRSLSTPQETRRETTSSSSQKWNSPNSLYSNDNNQPSDSLNAKANFSFNAIQTTNNTIIKSTNHRHSSSLGKDWKCTQECVFRTDGSEETIYQKSNDGVATETIHHIVYPDGTIKNIKRPIIVSSPSTTSSLSSLDDSTYTTSPFTRLWRLVFD